MAGMWRLLALVWLPLPAARTQVEEVQVRVEVALHRPQITLQMDTIFHKLILGEVW